MHGMGTFNNHIEFSDINKENIFICWLDHCISYNASNIPFIRESGSAGWTGGSGHLQVGWATTCRTRFLDAQFRYYEISVDYSEFPRFVSMSPWSFLLWSCLCRSIRSRGLQCTCLWIMWGCGTWGPRTGLASTWASSSISESTRTQTLGETNTPSRAMLCSVAGQSAIKFSQCNMDNSMP